MLKLNDTKISLFLIIIAMLLLIVSTGNCEAKYKFNMIEDAPLWGEMGLTMQAFESGVKYFSNGNIDIKMFPSGEWGIGVESGMQSLQLGTVDLLVTGISCLSRYTDALTFSEVPFLFKSGLDAAALAFDSTTKHTPLFAKALEKASKESKMMILSMAPMGERNIFSNKPINSIDDIKGMKIRVMSSPVQIDAFNFMGAIATPLPYTECFTALQLKAVDAAENSSAAYVTMKFIEPAPYYFKTDHMADFIAIVMSMKAWNSLPTAYQSIIRQAAVGALNVTTKWAAGANEYYLSNEIKNNAKAITVITPEEKLELRKMVLPKLLDKYGEKIGMDILEMLSEKDEVIANWLEENK